MGNTALNNTSPKKSFGFFILLLAAVLALAAGIYFLAIHGTFGLDSTHNGACYDPMVTWLLIGGAAVALVMNLKKNPDLHLHFRYIRWHGPTVKNIYRIGLPSILMMCIGSVMTFLLNRILLTFSTTATAVFGAYFKLQSFIFMPIFGLNNGMVPIIAYNYGAKNPDRVHRTIRLSILTAMSIMAVGTALFECIPGVLLGFFDASDHMLEIGVPALRIIGLHFIIAGFCIPAGSVCQAIGNPNYSLIVSICRQLVVLIPAAWLLAQTGNLNMVWFAFPIAEIMSLLMSSIFLRRTMRKADSVMSIGSKEL